MRKRRERITKGFAAVDDRTVWTLELNRDELMIILNGIKNHRIKGARMKLAALREQRNRRRDPGKAINVKSKKTSQHYLIKYIYEAPKRCPLGYFYRLACFL